MELVLALFGTKSVGRLPLQPPQSRQTWNRPHNSICGRWDCSDNNSVQYAHRATTFVIYSLLFSLIRDIHKLRSYKFSNLRQPPSCLCGICLEEKVYLLSHLLGVPPSLQGNDIIYEKPHMQRCNQINKWVYSISLMLFYTKRKISQHKGPFKK